MKRITLAGLVLAAACLTGSVVWAQEPGSTIRRYRIETTLSHLCFSLTEQLAGTRQACIAEVTKELRDRGISVRKIPYGTWVQVSVKPESENFTTQSTPPQTAVMVDPPKDGPDPNIVYNKLSVELQDRSEKLSAQITEVQNVAVEAKNQATEANARVQTLIERPSGPAASLPQELWWLVYAIGAGVLLIIALLILSVFRGARRLEEGHGRSKPMAKNPFAATEGRKALATLSDLIDHDEALKATNATLSGEVARLNQEKALLQKDLDRETKQAKEAAEKLSAASKALEEARKSGKASDAEIRRLQGVVNAAKEKAEKEEAERQAAEGKLAAAAEGIKAALKDEQQATQNQVKADATLKSVADELLLEGGERPKK